MVVPQAPDLIEIFSHGTGWNPGEYAYILKEYLARDKTGATVSVSGWTTPSAEPERAQYATYIINAYMAASRSSSTATCLTTA